MKATDTTAGQSRHPFKRMSDTNISAPVQFGMMVAGWVTVGYYDNDSQPTIYGVFPDLETAQEWLKQLTSGYIHPVYVPAYNRG
jgi:hypothetical protein